MKGSNIKSKMGRLTYSACALFLAGGAFVACEDDLLTGTPDWLGSSIYQELESRGNYQTMLDLINDPEVSNVNASTGQTENARTLSLTGSRTLFAASDEAFARFFENNQWGVRSYSDLSAAQKKLLLNSSMVGSAYLIELLSSSTGDDPSEGAIMRRSTAQTLYDSIPMLTAKDMPDNAYWKYYREKYPDGAQGGMYVFRDNTVSPMVHFLPDYMASKSITDNDLSFLTNGACHSTSEAYINGQRLTERDVTCQNGYIQVVENVMEPLTNMAEALRNDGELSVFSKMLDRFCVPVYSESLSRTLGVDSAFVWRYLNSGFDLGTTAANSLTSFRNVTYDPTDILSYDPGWNLYANASSSTPASEDMAAIIAPTDAAFDRYFQSGGGKLLIDRYGEVDSIPNHIIVNMMDNFMKYSMVATVPSKFSSVMNTAGLPMNLEVGEPGGETGLASCLMANNGVVYKSNQVYNIPEYQSVSFPASLDDSIRIMRYMIEDLDYQAYLNSMESEFFFILPTDAALSNYVDPVDYHKNQPTISEFYYDNSQVLSGNRIKCKRYNAVRNADGTLSRGEEIQNPWQNITEAEYVTNRLRDVLDNAIIVRENSNQKTGNKSVWVTKSGCPVILEGSGTGIRITTAFNKELAEQNNTPNVHEVTVRAEEGYYDMGSNPNGNGETFIVDAEPVMSANKSVPTLLGELAAKNDAYRGFYELLMRSSLVQENYNMTSITTGSGNVVPHYRTCSNGPTLSVMENYNYTIYVPPTSEIQRLYDNDILPSKADMDALEAELEAAEESGDYVEAERLEAEIESMDSILNNFIRYHIQNTAIYLSTSTSGTYETSFMNRGRFATLGITNSGQDAPGAITITCYDAQRNLVAGQDPRHVTEGNYFAREFRFRAGNSSSDASTSPTYCDDISSATRIFNSSMAVVHLIDKPLFYSKEMSDAYNDAANSGN